MSSDYLRSILEYDYQTGGFKWKYRMDAPPEVNSSRAGKGAFLGSNSYGYKIGYINKKQYLAHRVAWCIYYGEWPESDIDHINMDKSDNRIENLRLADRGQNMRNTGLRSDNTSGYKGVSFYKPTGKWKAQIKIPHGKVKNLGYYPTAEDAAEVYASAVKRYYGDFGRTE